MAGGARDGSGAEPRYDQEGVGSLARTASSTMKAKSGATGTRTAGDEPPLTGTSSAAATSATTQMRARNPRLRSKDPSVPYYRRIHP